MKLLIIFLSLCFVSHLEALSNSKFKQPIKIDDSVPPTYLKSPLDFDSKRARIKEPKKIVERDLQNPTDPIIDFEKSPQRDSKLYLDIDPNSILPIRIHNPDARVSYSQQSKIRHKLPEERLLNKDPEFDNIPLIRLETTSTTKIFPTSTTTIFPTSTTTIFPTSTTEKILDYHNTPIIEPNEEFSFHANESFLHFRTESWLISFDDCLEFKYRIEGKRTRLLVYTCQMTENGICVLDKFTSKPVGTTGDFSIERCHRLRPWIFHPESFGFHFKFVRRPRKFGDKEREEIYKRRRRGRRAVREVGRVTLTGFQNCANTCRSYKNKDDDKYRPSNVKIAPNYNPYEGLKKI